ncbi:hypothetical protein IGI04_015058 [Brassica rapa subsp. trilocularis]|uniref:Uncharacterized protein n=1 Tax=Brassica rapa subsp. trilocularis TaxID=1813537 RepID=A0ABQ7MRH0_BRACM|nr:hypothetical protein IGI04_015058 [Brassica rapa subsp. trilocularis]
MTKELSRVDEPDIGDPTSVSIDTNSYYRSTLLKILERSSMKQSLPGYAVELESVEERTHKSKASHLAVPKHVKPPICTGEAAASFTKRYRFELAFQCHRFEVKQHPIEEVMSVLLKSGESASREEAVEEMKDYRSTVHP